MSNPVDCGGPPVADARGRKILDAILADTNVDILSSRSPARSSTFSEPFTRDLIDVAKTTDKPIFVVWGAPSGTDDTYYKRLLDGGLPVFRTFDNCVDAVQRLRRLLDVRGALPVAVRRRADDAVARREEGARAARRSRARARRSRSGRAKQLLKAYGIKSSKDELVRRRRPRRCSAAKRDRLSRS